MERLRGLGDLDRSDCLARCQEIQTDLGRIVAVRPKHAFAPFFRKRAKTTWKERERRDSAPR